MSRLTDADLARMRAEHVEHPSIRGVLGMVAYCAGCYDEWPCDASLLLAHFAPGSVPHLAGLAYGLCGPSRTEEL